MNSDLELIVIWHCDFGIPVAGGMAMGIIRVQIDYPQVI